jgi:hypothetical protein
MKRLASRFTASSYYLVVALSTMSEGSYGTSSAGAEIPVGRIGTISTLRHRPPPSWSR